MRAARPSLVLLLSVALMGVSGQVIAQSPSPTEPAASTAPAASATPEGAVAAYIAAIAATDPAAILAASAVDEMATGFRFAPFAERLAALMLTNSLAPAEDPFYAQLNRAQQAWRILAQVQNLAYGLLSGVEIDGTPIAPIELAEAEAFAAAVDSSRLAGLEVLAVRFPDPKFATDERYLANGARIAALYSADEQTERLALISLEGSLYALGFTLLRYGDAWKVANQASPIAGTSSMGTAVPTTQADYDAQTGG